MRKNFTWTKFSTQVRQRNGYLKIFKTVFSLVLLLAVFLAGCKKDNYKGEIKGVCPVVVSTDPMNKAVDVILGKVISATFNTAMKAATINTTTFIIMQGSTSIAGTVAPTANNAVFTFKPTVALLPFTTYTGTITTSAKDTLGSAMVSAYVWTFTTIPQVTLSSNPAAGGITAGGGTFANGSLATVTATPNTGYAFTNWTNNGVIASKSPSYQFTMAGNISLVANFAPVVAGKFALTLSSSPAAGGTTVGSGLYNAGSSVTATATPNTGYTFTNWTDNGVIASVSSSYQFVLAGNRTLVANFKLIPSSQFAVVLSSNPPSGGTTTGSGSYNAGSSVNVTATANAGYTFTNWTNNGVIASTSSSYTFALNANVTLVANFAINTYTINITAVNGIVVKNPNQPNYNNGTTVQLTATPNPGYSFSSWSGDATGSTNPLTVIMNMNKNITANFTLNPAIGPGVVNLGGAGNFNILTKSGISTTGITSITGNIGVSPASATSITGFGLIMDASGQSAHTPIVNGKVYASDYAAPTPANLTTAVNDMQTAFTTANNLVTPAPVVNLGAGNISGLTLAPGLYKWSTGVLISNAGVTLAGGPNDTWVFQIAQDLTVNSSAKITLLGGAQAKNIFWIVTGQATLGTNVDFSGNILSKTLISLNTGAKVTGRLLAQTAVTLNASTVVMP
jgi:hypothetical protein